MNICVLTIALKSGVGVEEAERLMNHFRNFHDVAYVKGAIWTHEQLARAQAMEQRLSELLAAAEAGECSPSA